MNVLLIGSGAREHAIARAIDNSQNNNSLHCFASNINPGIADVCSGFSLGNINDPKDVVRYAKETSSTLAVIGPENPLASGVADALWDVGVKVVGPKKDLAQVETSKAFTRDLLKEYNISGGPRYQTFGSMIGIDDFLTELGEKYVVKYDGLAGGKGVKVAGDHLQSHEDALDYCMELVDKGGKVVIEEKFIGQEFSIMSFCDGKTLRHMPAVQDHKRAYEGDTGPNTGGMGTYSDADHSLPFLKDSEIQEAHTINVATAKALKNKFGEGYKGVLYGGFMATGTGVKLIEYNARFGDPEAMNVLPLLKSDFVDICESIADGTLDGIDVQFQNKASVCKYAVPEGYPDDPVKGEPINVSSLENSDRLFYASVDIKHGSLVEAGSRTVAVVGIADSIAEAEVIAEKEVSSVSGPLFHRSDIGTETVIQDRINHMSSLR
jgi:phosphoribosylamine--glycine ligase